MSSGWFDSTARCLCTSSGWFKHVEPPRTFSNHIIAEMARCVEFFHMSSGWFDSTELSLTTYLYGKEGVQGALAIVRGSSTTSNLLEPFRTTSLQRWQGVLSFFTKYIFTVEARCAGCLRTSSGWFKHVEPLRTFSNHIIAKMARCVEFFHISSRWSTLPNGAYALVRGSSALPNFH